MRVCLEAETAAVYCRRQPLWLSQHLLKKPSWQKKNVRIERLVWYQLCLLLLPHFAFVLFTACYVPKSQLAGSHKRLWSAEWSRHCWLIWTLIFCTHYFTTLFFLLLSSTFYNSSKLLIQIAEYINDVAADIFDPRGRALFVQLKVWKVDRPFLTQLKIIKRGEAGPTTLCQWITPVQINATN